MADGAPHSAELPAIAIAPHHTVNLAVPSLIAAAGLQNLTGSLNVVLDTKAQPGALALASGSVDQTNTYVFEVIPHGVGEGDRKSTRLNSSHPSNSYAVFCLKKKSKVLEN